MRRLMHSLAHLLPARPDGANPAAVRAFRTVGTVRELLSAGGWQRALQRLRGQHPWPVTSGAYALGDAHGPVAICTLTSNDLFPTLAALPGVAIAGRVYVPNLGIEKIIRNVTANPNIRFLLLCGVESPIFQPGQALRCLVADGVDTEGRIIGAVGHLPVLRHLSAAHIATFRQQVDMVDMLGQTDPAILATQVAGLVARDPGPYMREDGALPRVTDAAGRDPRFVPLPTGGRRSPLAADPKGFFVITLDRAAGQIVLQHYLPDQTPAHELRSHTAEAILRGLLRAELVSQLSHAGYLGGELARAEAALRLDLHYEQDQPLRRTMPSLPGQRKHYL